MYIGKHQGAPFKENIEEDRIHIPENYAGNAFCVEKQEEPIACTCDDGAVTELCHDMHKKAGCFKADSLFSTDALLVLLAILLFGSEESNELSIILLLLLLF